MNYFGSVAETAIRNYQIPWFMYAAVLLALVGYAIIEAKHSKHDHVIKFKEAVHWSIFYISLALAFSIPIFIFVGSQAGAEYLAAWALEKALSLDNLFVIGLIFATYKVPPELRRRMLNYGIAGAIVFRLLFILLGVELLSRFVWISIFFGLILLRAAWKTLEEATSKNHEDAEKEADVANIKVWRFMTRHLPIHNKYDGHKLTTVVNGKRMLTMMAGIIILIEFTDIMFAIDSVPAVLAVSPDRFIAYSSNVFALLGLRALFFVYQAVEDKFWALNWALAGILTWISFKMISAPLGLHVPVGGSLSVLGTLLGGGVLISLLFPKHPHPQK
jgi:tellurite resistance protein TerC